MNIGMKKLSILSGALLTAYSLQAAVLVDLTGENLNTANDGSTLTLTWSGASDSTTTNWGGTAANDYARSRTFSSPTTNYAGPAFSGRSVAVTYDSASIAYDNGASSSNIGIRDLDPNPDSFNIRAGANGGAGSGITVWQIGFAQSDWATLNTGNIGFDATSSFNISGIAGSVEAWLMVVANGTSYVATTSGSIADLSAVNFNSYDNRNATQALWNPGSGTTLAGSALSNITEVGLYIEMDVADTTAANGISNFTQFEITAIPEPSSLALIGLAFGAVALFRRRRR